MHGYLPLTLTRFTVGYTLRTSQDCTFINFMTEEARTGGPAPSHAPTVKRVIKRHPG